MRGISEERLRKIARETHNSDDTNIPVLSLLDMLITECWELQEPRMTFEEFLKSQPNDCWCWIHTATYVDMAYFSDGTFRWDDRANAEEFQLFDITHVTPLYKPEAPK